MKRYRNRIIIGLALGFGVLAVTLLLGDINALVQQAVNFPWWVMAPVLALRCLNWLLRFFKWDFYLRVVGVEGISRRDSAVVFLSGFPLALSPGKMAEVLKSLFVKQLSGAPIASTLPVVFAERISDGVAVLLLLGISIVALAATEFWSVAITFLVIFAVGIGILQHRKLSLWLLDRAARLPLVRRLAGPLREFYESSHALVRWRSIIVALGLGFTANFLDAIGVYLILLGIGLPATPDVFFQALLVISLSVVVGAASALPGGLGAADLSIGVTMSTVVGLSVAEAAFATLLVRFVQLWWGVIVGMGVGLLFRKVLLPQDGVSLEQAVQGTEPKAAVPGADAVGLR